MSEPLRIGSSEWFTQVADKLINVGTDALRSKLLVRDPDGTPTNTNNVASIQSAMLTGKVPLILGALALVGIVVILAKR